MVSYPLEWVEFRHDADGITPRLSNRADTTGLSHPRIFMVELGDLRRGDFRVIESIQPDGFSRSEAGAIGATMGVVAGGMGGYVAGSLVGEAGEIAAKVAAAANGMTAFTAIPMGLSFGGGVAGAAFGAAAGGGAGYLVGEQFLTGLRIMDGGSEARSNHVFEQPQRMVVAELLSDDDLMSTLERAAREHVNKLVNNLGLERVNPAMIV